MNVQPLHDSGMSGIKSWIRDQTRIFGQPRWTWRFVCHPDSAIRIFSQRSDNQYSYIGTVHAEFVTTRRNLGQILTKVVTLSRVNNDVSSAA